MYQVYRKARMRQLHSNPIAVSGSGHTGKNQNQIHSTLSSTCKKVRLTSGSQQDAAHPSCDSPSHHHGASRCLVPAMSAWSVKTRRAPSRHCRDARAYGHTTTPMHGNEYPPPLAVRVSGAPSMRRIYSDTLLNDLPGMSLLIDP